MGGSQHTAEVPEVPVKIRPKNLRAWLSHIGLSWCGGKRGEIVERPAPFRVWYVATLDCQLHFHSFDTERLPPLSQRDST